MFGKRRGLSLALSIAHLKASACIMPGLKGAPSSALVNENIPPIVIASVKAEGKEKMNEKLEGGNSAS